MRHTEIIRLFRQISEKYPASVIAQSAALTLETKQNRTIPRRLSLLRDDAEAIELVATIAEAAHHRSQKNKAPLFVNRDILRGVLDSELEWIPRMSRLRQASLQNILDNYGAFPDEKAFDAFVEETYFPVS